MTMPVRPMGIPSMNPRTGPVPAPGGQSPLMRILASLAGGRGAPAAAPGGVPHAPAMPGQSVDRYALLARARRAGPGGLPSPNPSLPGGPAIPPEQPPGGPFGGGTPATPIGLPRRFPVPNKNMYGTEPQNGLPPYMRGSMRSPMVMGNQ